MSASGSPSGSNLQHAIRLQLRHNLVHRAPHEQLALLDDADFVAEVRQFGQDVRGDQHDFAHRAQLADEFLDLDAGARV
jgi:hypothetical protein